MASNPLSSGSSKGSWFLLLFGLPFTAVGLFFAWELAATVREFYAAKQWVETPATILSTELKKKTGSKGHVSYEVRATYDYRFDGQRHNGDRVSLAGKFELDAYDKRKHKQLKKLLGKPNGAVCFVDPDEPSRSVLDRELRASSIAIQIPFAVCFSLVGLGVLGAGVYGRVAARGRVARLAESPDEPWRVREDWAAGEIACTGWTPVLVMGAGAVLWNGLTLPMAFLVGTDSDVPSFVPWLMGAFVLVGVGLLVAMLYQLIRRLRYGSSLFRMAGTPGVVGGELAGVVLAPANVQPEDAFRVTLACRETRTVRRGNKRSTETVTIWEDTRLIDRTLHDPTGKQGVPVRFVIPSEADPTDPDADRPISWQLTVEAKTPGPDYKADFAVPVFITADSADGVVEPEDPLTDYELDESLAASLRRVGLRCEQPGPDGLRVSRPPFRSVGNACFFALFGAVCIAVAVGTASVDESIVRIVFPVVFGGIGVLMVIGALGSLLGCSDLAIEGDRWRARTGWYGLRGRGREFGPADVRDLRLKQTMKSSSGSKTTVWNQVEAELADGKSVTLVKGLSDRGAERRLLGELHRLAGLGDSAGDSDQDANDGWDGLQGLAQDERGLV